MRIRSVNSSNGALLLDMRARAMHAISREARGCARAARSTLAALKHTFFGRQFVADVSFKDGDVSFEVFESPLVRSNGGWQRSDVIGEDCLRLRVVVTGDRAADADDADVVVRGTDRAQDIRTAIASTQWPGSDVETR